MRKGQSTIEYVVVICAIALAFFAMRAYVKRAVQGKQKAALEQVGAGEYAPGQTQGITETRKRIEEAGDSYSLGDTETSPVTINRSNIVTQQEVERSEDVEGYR